jgi:hypothetical protein
MLRLRLSSSPNDRQRQLALDAFLNRQYPYRAKQHHDPCILEDYSAPINACIRSRSSVRDATLSETPKRSEISDAPPPVITLGRGRCLTTVPLHREFLLCVWNAARGRRLCKLSKSIDDATVGGTEHRMMVPSVVTPLTHSRLSWGNGYWI